jgi:hypothetical protein
MLNQEPVRELYRTNNNHYYERSKPTAARQAHRCVIAVDSVARVQCSWLGIWRG